MAAAVLAAVVEAAALAAVVVAAALAGAGDGYGHLRWNVKIYR